jgi:hypothetical protein
LLKPSSYLIEEAVRGLNADPAATALVGDSLTDIEAAHSAGIASIGYANQPGKHENMTQAQAKAVITSLADLALSFQSPADHRPCIRPRRQQSRRQKDVRHLQTRTATAAALPARRPRPTAGPGA